ncbi:hypothetical protein TSUD_301710 [Trifolium subterraneum]|uniref:RNase H type-1 domain-containing protein n=1 Tax=Trifolium subterraneum TaxID=3900 RepID=A0A2Z6NZL8_TRISU|nr:hypothetical protein TSUD_301710 [Trifolium subterraneum]
MLVRCDLNPVAGTAAAEVAAAQDLNRVSKYKVHYNGKNLPSDSINHKCNVDATFHKEEMKTSAGWCVRDHTGQFTMAGTSWIQGRCSIIEGEAIALMEAMKEVKFTKRQANMVAHKLARAAISWASRYYLEMIPICIEIILIN